MSVNFRNSALAAVVLFLGMTYTPGDLVAQGANVDVTILPQPSGDRSGFLVCVGSTTDVDQYGTEVTGTTGVANQNFRNLPVGTAVRVTVTKSGYTGVQLNWTLRAGWDNHLQASMLTGSGGPTCATATAPPTTIPPPSPRIEVRTPLTTSTAIAPDPPRLGPELLARHGGDPDDHFFHQYALNYDCRRFGGNYVMTGLKVRHRVTSLIGIDLYCAPLRSDGTLGTRIFLPAMAPTSGTPAEATCPSGQAVIGYQGTLSLTDAIDPIRSLTLHCARLTSMGLSTGASTRLPALGINSGGVWGPDMCHQNRPASGIKASGAEASVATIQLMCEQPQRP